MPARQPAPEPPPDRGYNSEPLPWQEEAWTARKDMAKATMASNGALMRPSVMAPRWRSRRRVYAA